MARCFEVLNFRFSEMALCRSPSQRDRKTDFQISTGKFANKEISTTIIYSENITPTSCFCTVRKKGV